MKHNKIVTAVALILLVGILCTAFLGCGTKKISMYQDVCFDYFDTVTTFSAYASSEAEFKTQAKLVKDELGKYHRLFDIYKTYDGVNNLAYINMKRGSADSPIPVDRILIDFLLYAKEMHRLTSGEMNIAMGSVLSIWHNYRAEGEQNPVLASVPEMTVLKEAALHTNIDDIVIDEINNTVYLADSRLSIDVGAIGKGYATEKVAKQLELSGIIGGSLNVGGNVRTIGNKPNGESWIVGIENPDENKEKPIVAQIKIESKSVVTSGTYQRFYIVDGKSYHHIIDKDTLMPSVGYKSCTVVCADSGLADSLSTALFCMSIEDGLNLLKELSDVSAMWVRDSGDVVYSPGFEALVK